MWKSNVQIRPHIKEMLMRETAKNEILNQQYEMLQKAYSDNAMLFHDMNNHLQTIYNLAESEDYAAIQQYIARISAPTEQLSGILWTGVGIVDAILNAKKELALKKGYQIDINAQLPINTGITSDDFCTILGNLIDNAIESMDRQHISDTTSPICITLRRINHFLIFQVSNPCSQPPRRKLDLFQSVKRDSQRHGWGLKSVKRAVLKYNGTFSCDMEGDRFVATAMVFYPENNSI